MILAANLSHFAQDSQLVKPNHENSQKYQLPPTGSNHNMSITGKRFRCQQKTGLLL